MEITFAHICDYASISREGKLSVMGIFDGIAASQIPTRHPQMYLAFQVELNHAELNREFTIEIDMRDADGGHVMQAKAEMTVEGKAKIGDRPRVAQVISLRDIVFSREGAYNVNIWAGGALKKQLDFRVHRTAPPPAPPRLPGV